MEPGAYERIDVVLGDITDLSVDAIVNAANRRLERGGGVCGAIHAAAGPQLAAACRADVTAHGTCDTGDARLTDGFALPARYVIHAVGPVWHGGNDGEAELLASAYRRSLELATAAGCDAVAFPSISTGIFGYPPAAAVEVALTAIGDYLTTHAQPARVVCCCFGRDDADRYRRALAARRGHT